MRNLILGQVLVVLGPGWVGVSAALGQAQELVWSAIMLFFFMPMAASVICLGRVMPAEGGLYAWARRAFGDQVGFLTAWNLWMFAIISTAAILLEVPSELAYMIGQRAAWLTEDHLATFTIAAGVLGLIAVLTIRGLTVGRWLHDLSGAAVLVAFGLLVAQPLWTSYQHPPVHDAVSCCVVPSANLHTVALIGQMSFALAGLEYLAILAGETIDAGRNLVRSIWIAGPLICGLTILGSSVVLSVHQAHPGIPIDLIAPIAQTVRLGMDGAGGVRYMPVLILLLLQLRLFGACSILFTSLTRLPMTASWDDLAPPSFTRLTRRYSTPANSIVFSAIAVLLVLLLASVGVRAQEAYQVLNDTSSILYLLTYLVLFAIPLIGAWKFRASLPNWLKVTSASGVCTVIFSLTVFSYPIVDVPSPWHFFLKVIGTAVGVNLFGVALYKDNVSIASNSVGTM